MKPKGATLRLRLGAQRPGQGWRLRSKASRKAGQPLSLAARLLLARVPGVEEGEQGEAAGRAQDWLLLSGRSVRINASASQSACCAWVQPSSSQSMRPTSGLAKAHMISPARHV